MRVLFHIEKRMTPIEKVIQFMKDRELRTAEFFRILDKDASRNLTHEELAKRMLVCESHCICCYLHVIVLQEDI